MIGTIEGIHEGNYTKLKEVFLKGYFHKRGGAYMFHSNGGLDNKKSLERIEDRECYERSML
jgi:hypothetical protein